MFVAVEIIRARVVGYVKIHPSVTIEIAPQGAHPKAAIRVRHACLLGDIGKRPISIVMKK